MAVDKTFLGTGWGFPPQFHSGVQGVMLVSQEEDIQEGLSELVASVKTNENIHLHLDTTLDEVEGFVGNFKSTLTANGEGQTIDHGVAVIATGAAMVFLAWDNTDLIPARRLTPFSQRFKLMTGTLPFHLGFGLPFLIPVLNIVLLSFAPVGATLYFVEKQEPLSSIVRVSPATGPCQA